MVFQEYNYNVCGDGISGGTCVSDFGMSSQRYLYVRIYDRITSNFLKIMNATNTHTILNYVFIL